MNDYQFLRWLSDEQLAKFADDAHRRRFQKTPREKLVVVAMFSALMVGLIGAAGAIFTALDRLHSYEIAVFIAGVALVAAGLRGLRTHDSDHQNWIAAMREQERRASSR